ncbi:MAG: protein-tyrosine-phosphatase, partial [Mesorhizobium sp.]
MRAALAGLILTGLPHSILFVCGMNVVR